MKRQLNFFGIFSQQSHTPQETRHFPTLDGARGFAAVIVVVSHSANAGLIPSFLGMGLGQMGVILFYVLSGFLVSYLYAHRKLSVSTIKSYAIARFSRVFPLYYFVLIFSTLFLLLYGVSLYGYSNNAGLFLNALMLRGSSVLWSIPVEVHYYFCFLFLWLSCSLKRPLTGILLMVMLQVTTAIIAHRTSDALLILPYWAHFFLIGHVIAIIYRKYEHLILSFRSNRSFILLGYLTLISFIIAPPKLRYDIGLPVLPPFADPISAGLPILVFLFALISISPFSWLAAEPFRWLGKISYSIYLLHMPIIIGIAYLPAPLLNIPGLAFIVVIVATLAASTLTFRVVEKGAQSILRKQTGPR